MGILNRAGGPWLITDMRRGECIFDIDPSLKEQLEIGIEMDGSNLSGVSCRVEWSEAENYEEDKENRRIDAGWPSINDYG